MKFSAPSCLVGESISEFGITVTVLGIPEKKRSIRLLDNVVYIVEPESIRLKISNGNSTFETTVPLFEPIVLDGTIKIAILYTEPEVRIAIESSMHIADLDESAEEAA